MTMRQLLSYVRRACADHQMIAPNDKIAVGISGGKDSLTVLAALAALRRFYPVPFELTAITVDLGFQDFDTEPVAAFCRAWGVPFTRVPTDIGPIVFDIRREKNPCALCAKMRKAALNAEAKRQACTRVAYGHNRDDFIHTFFLSLFYEGRIHTIEPVMYLDRSELYCIRPLLYVPEQDVVGFAKREHLPVLKSPCPANGQTKREAIRRKVVALRGEYERFDEKVFGAIRRYWQQAHTKEEGE